jgi:hypothetical protein
LLASGVGGLCLFNGLSIWTSLLAPRPTNFETTFGNQLSLSANVLLIGGLLGGMAGVFAVDKFVGPAAVLNYWWVTIPAAALSIVFYIFSLRRGAAVFVSRRERLLNTLEGRN